MPRYSIEITSEAEHDLAYYRTHERKAIVEGIVSQLSYEPGKETANRKRLRDNPIATWELRIGKYRVFYEIETEPLLDEDEQAIIIIISVGHKEHNVLYIRGKVIKL